jgi:hypothetical protein
MTTNVVLGFPFGAISIFLHAFLLIFDPRKSFRFYNVSLLIWVIGNFIWMTTEFVAEPPSSTVHLGPTVPLGGLSKQTIENMVNAKSVLFLISSSIQILMYILIFCRVIPMPEDDEEDMVSKNEAVLFFYGSQSYSKNLQDHMALDNSDDVHIISLDDVGSEKGSRGNAGPSYGFSLIFIENGYILFWILKDLCWSWGTGDLTDDQQTAIAFESLAMCCGTVSIFIYALTSYLYRRNTLRFLDAITTIFWIAANFVWMSGEFFLRYDNLEYDDQTQGNDYNTRVASATLFLLGLLVQAYIVLAVCVSVMSSQNSLVRPSASRNRGERSAVELLSMSNVVVSLTFNPLSHQSNANSLDQEVGESSNKTGGSNLPLATGKIFKSGGAIRLGKHQRLAVADEYEEESTILF